MSNSEIPHTQRGIADVSAKIFVMLGILPFLLVGSALALGFIEPRFWSIENLTNVLRQSSYLSIIAMGQALVLLTGNFDLSVGSNIALVSVVSNLVSEAVLQANPEADGLAIIGAVGSGLCVGFALGALNGFGVAVMKVHSFIMTLGTMSFAFGLALMLSKGMPVSGVPQSFGDIFAYGRIFGVPAPVVATLIILLALYILLSQTRFGRHVYAVGSNSVAARLSGINTPFYVFAAHTLCGVVVSVGAILLTARVGTGEAGIGSQFALSSITACVLGGISLLGGSGAIVNVVLGAFFLAVLANGMTMIRVGSYSQIMADGVLLILAIWAEQGRLKVAAWLHRRRKEA